MDYNWFAKVYDDLMDETLYQQWLKYTEEHIPNEEQILELGSGTGILGIKLKEKGYDISGLDLSDEMLSLAFNRQMESGVTFPLIQGDMKNLADLPLYSNIICYSDALCYMKNENELLSVFKEVYSKLEKGGMFLFDVHSIYQISEFLRTSFHAETDNIVFLWDSFEGDHPHSVEHQLSFFVNDTENRYERYEEVHKERTYPLETYSKLLKEVGFLNIEIKADFTEEVTDDSKRWFFACSK
ncbi:MAG: class I SAM-dependent DNA methyltransferase [Alkalibacterium gilvum]|uniref:Methyltransferase domain-containing protein n=1 Tax=Alkalibacterium gilvum TaxID=1130080 RepID=A0A1H6TQ71_9LACT|nr:MULTISPECIES: class I SAM-dependent methyltransferase [Alkalibacterium]MDN6194665.1 class I SAM-dependent methyltransferase [Alkalibacterium sp.]MDN6293135.1 class I SAM-dependent methyltransferase [Alkalibacterium sp.]MDN6295052.1 class I SAM-dependent methyltransferase [Alkalibacterium sp.]MDN6397588.1 class I SAM-dependent methyltransferase [Alkalibacterium sp.]MDN6729962.1 class I SAM-dependent methyltransferase [Alkalibacterium sp.]